MNENRKMIYCGVVAKYHSHDTRWFAIIGFAPMIVGALGMLGSTISYFGLSLDIGLFLGLGPFILTESMLMILVILIISMLFFAGGIEWYVLCSTALIHEYVFFKHVRDQCPYIDLYFVR